MLVHGGPRAHCSCGAESAACKRWKRTHFLRCPNNAPMQCTFCDKECSDNSSDDRMLLCEEHLEMFSPPGSPALVTGSSSPSPLPSPMPLSASLPSPLSLSTSLRPAVAIPLSPGLLRFYHGGLSNAFAVTTAGRVSASISSALTGAPAGYAYALPSTASGVVTVEYAVPSPHVHRVTVDVAVDGALVASYCVPDTVHFSGQRLRTRAFSPSPFVYALAVSPDGQGAILSSAQCEDWLLFNPQTEEAPVTVGFPAPAAHVCWSAHRSLLAVADEDATCVLELSLRGEALRALEFGTPLGVVAASLYLVACACTTGDERVRRIRFVDYCSGEVTHAWGNWGCAHAGYLEVVSALKFTPDGEQLAVAGSHPGVYLYDVRDGTLLRALGGAALPHILDMEIIDGGRSVLVLCGSTLRTLSVRTGQAQDEVTCAPAAQLAQSVHCVVTYDPIAHATETYA